ncbi:gp53-like domain-containing protein [Escherichia coli]|uniref:gp53-like domain-containing protein n=1 Tax=Escherichia coli TaxID=562 RepID=UPI001F05F0DC|nr:hypothetical protein [Escherichia coli]
MIYSTGTISINGNTATGSGTNWTAPASQVRAGQTIIVMSNPVQLFQISSVNSATSMTVTPAASPALSGQKYGILVTDSLSVDGLAQSMSQLINEYDENIGAWETFATTSANQSITVTINGTSVTIPGIGKLAQKGSNGALAIADGGTGATNAAGALANFGIGPIATAGEIQAGTPRKLIDAELLKQYLPAKALPPSGYVRIPDVPGGMIVQWGQVDAVIYEGGQIVTLPTPFPNAVRFAIAIPLNATNNGECDLIAQLQSASATQINFFFSWVSIAVPANGFQWLAIGY